jgi:hypothetical protein
MAGNLSMVLASPLLFYLYSQGAVGTTIAAIALHAVLMALVGAPLPAYMAEGFPAAVRYSAVAVGYNIVTAVFGGTAPLVATAIVAANPSFFLGPALYLSGLAGLAALTLALTPRLLGGTRNYLDSEAAAAAAAATSAAESVGDEGEHDGGGEGDRVELLPVSMRGGASAPGPASSAHDDSDDDGNRDKDDDDGHRPLA